MDRQEIDRLLAEYATGGLSAAEKQKLFAAALHHQDLFDQLMEEDSLREAIELPGARNRLIDSLQEETVNAMDTMAPAGAAPARARAKETPSRPRQPLWLAWASGIAIVLVSGAISYVAFDRPLPKEIASVFTPRPTPKEFVPPPAAPAAAKPRVASVEPPPAIPASAGSGSAAAPPPVNIPLPSAPPPAPDPSKENKVAGGVSSARVERDQVPTGFRAAAPSAKTISAPSPAPDPSNENKVAGDVSSARVEREQVLTEFRAAPGQQQSKGGAAPSPKPIAAPPPPRRSVAETVAVGADSIGRVAKSEASVEERAKLAQSTPTLWRLAADGVWVRVPANAKAPRSATLVIRYSPATTASVTVTDSNGRRLVQRQGRPGVELELPLPAPSANATGLTLSINEGPRSTPFTILFEDQ